MTNVPSLPCVVNMYELVMSKQIIWHFVTSVKSMIRPQKKGEWVRPFVVRDHVELRVRVVFIWVVRVRKKNLDLFTLYKYLISRNFLEFCLEVEIAHCGTQFGNYGNSLLHIFGKNFVKVMVLLNKLLNSWFDEICFWWEGISRFSTMCTVWQWISRFSTLCTTGCVFHANPDTNRLFSPLYTVWKFQVFLSQILREIRFGEVGSAFFAVFGPLNFVNLLKYNLQKVQ